MNREDTTHHFDRVREFHRKAEHARPDAPEIPSVEVRVLRAKLILEEALETIHALGIRPRLIAVTIEMDSVYLDDEVYEPDLIGIADGCADLSVVTTGTLVACGIADSPLLEEVDKNNLKKFEHICPKCSTDISEERTHQCSMIRDAVPGHVGCPNCNHMWITGYRREDGKWIKPENHKPPDIASVLKDQGWEPSAPLCMIVEEKDGLLSGLFKKSSDENG